MEYYWSHDSWFHGVQHALHMRQRLRHACHVLDEGRHVMLLIGLVVGRLSFRGWRDRRSCSFLFLFIVFRSRGQPLSRRLSTPADAACPCLLGARHQQVLVVHARLID